MTEQLTFSLFILLSGGGLFSILEEGHIAQLAGMWGLGSLTRNQTHTP